MALGYLSPFNRGGSPARTGRFAGGSLFDLHRQMNRLFDDLLEPSNAPAGSGGGGGAGLSMGAGFPQLEIDQDDKHIEISAELPGVRQEDVELTLEDGMLTIAGEKKSERKDENGYTERSYGRFERRMTLPSNIDEDACRADFKDGVLKVTIPKAEEKARGRRIPLGQSAQSTLSGSGSGSSGGHAHEGGTIEGRADEKADNKQKA